MSASAKEKQQRFDSYNVLTISLLPLGTVACTFFRQPFSK